jgi:TPR repeat protein
MKQGRTPDRVHVVRPPQDDYAAEAAARISVPQPNNKALEIVRTLAQISDKLKRSEAERYELLAELREYRKSLIELEDKVEKSEKAYQSLEGKVKSQDAIENEISQRQARFERALKETENKLVQAAAGQSLLDQRVKETESFQTAVTQRLDDTVSQQARLDRSIEKISQDKSRMLRKVERMEEILTETQDTLKARALVLLTDRSAAAQAALPHMPAYAEDGIPAIESDMPWWRRSVRLQGVGMAAMLIAAVLIGWTINQIQSPKLPEIAVMEDGKLARLDIENDRWEPVKIGDAKPEKTSVAPPEIKSREPTLTPLKVGTVEETPQPETAPQPPAAQEALSASDDELMAALEQDPDKLAAKLNEIEPEAQKELDVPSEPIPLSATAKGYDPLRAMERKAFAQNPRLANEIAKEKGKLPLAQRMMADESLPEPMQKLQAQAYDGVAEAQHDLAAIYTAGKGGVAQNFERAAFWFREAADKKIANAAYNLGVLYHQGLGTEKDMERAIYWYREAARLGHPEAQYNLGIAYIEGIGTEYNAPLAAAFFESAANAGVVEAAYNLGLIYENGLIGNMVKNEDALMWYKIASDGGNADAKAALQQLAATMEIGMKDVEKMTDRMESIYRSSHGRLPGPAGKA